MIGWRVAIETDEMPSIWGLISLADGMFTQLGSGTKADVAQAMNEAGYYMPIELLGVR
jgi:hypothetical protein